MKSIRAILESRRAGKHSLQCLLNVFSVLCSYFPSTTSKTRIFLHYIHYFSCKIILILICYFIMITGPKISGDHAGSTQTPQQWRICADEGVTELVTTTRRRLCMFTGLVSTIIERAKRQSSVSSVHRATNRSCTSSVVHSLCLRILVVVTFRTVV